MKKTVFTAVLLTLAFFSVTAAYAQTLPNPARILRLAREAQEQAAAQAIAAERSQPQRDEDFEVRQNPDNTLTITGYKRIAADLVIPPTLYGLRVTIIGAGAFYHKDILSVVIPDTVIEIGKEAFDGGGRQFSPLSRVTIGRGVRKIGEDAFRGNNLTEIIIPDSVVEIGASAFSGCGLTSITWGRGLQTIGQRAFSGNELTSVTIPAGVKNIGDIAFNGNRITSVSLPGGITEFGRSVFDNTTIVRATLPANANYINSSSFDVSLVSFYANQNRAAGTYVKNGPIWTRQ
jgi:hypothetical protein